MAITIEKELYLFDGDTEEQSGEMHSVVRMFTTGDNRVMLEMDDGDEYAFCDLSDYEKELVVAHLVNECIV